MFNLHISQEQIVPNETNSACASACLNSYKSVFYKGLLSLFFCFVSYIEWAVTRWHNTLSDKGKYGRDPRGRFWLLNWCELVPLFICKNHVPPNIYLWKKSASWVQEATDIYFLPLYYFSFLWSGHIDCCPSEHSTISPSWKQSGKR